jgi:hypothetical protein
VNHSRRIAWFRNRDAALRQMNVIVAVDISGDRPGEAA